MDVPTPALAVPGAVSGPAGTPGHAGCVSLPPISKGIAGEGGPLPQCGATLLLSSCVGICSERGDGNNADPQLALSNSAAGLD